jgi:hypothetical protein
LSRLFGLLRLGFCALVRNHEVVSTKPEDFGPTIFTDFLCGFMEQSVQAGKPF